MKRFSLHAPGHERAIVAALALLATYAFFYEYLPPFHGVHIFSDIEGYHYPLQRYAFDSLKHGRFPQWDPSIYGGISFVANVQAALLYPPTWLMYAASWRFPQIPFRSLEFFAFAHVWLAFFLCYLWLRGRRLGKLPSALGAGVFAYGGYMVSQIVHLGVATGLAWMPLGLWGIDEAVERRDWRPLWKTALASAMSFLAGYPASWLVFCMTTFLYALASRAHWRAAAGVCAAVAASMLLAMVELAPALEARSYMVYGPKYGGGADTWRFFIPLFVPNWFDFNFRSHAPFPTALYLYLGLPAIFAIAWALRRFQIGPYAQALVPAAFCFVLGANAGQWPYRLIVKIPSLERVAQSYNFFEGFAAMAALITAVGMHDFLRRTSRKAAASRGLTAVSVMALAAFSAWQTWRWLDGATFPTGIRALAETAVALALFSLVLFRYRAHVGARRAWVAAALLLAAGIDYKVFGTDRRFNTGEGDVDELEASYGIRGMNDEAYRALWTNRDYRIACDEMAAPYSTDLRQWDLATPQGFDPFLPTQYHDAIERWVKFKTNRLFFVDVHNERMLQALGVRYVITHEKTANDPFLSASPNFRLVGPDHSFYRVYEYKAAKPPYGWEDGSGDVRPLAWQPERRVFLARSDRGGQFDFVEQFYPGWHATVDGRPAAIERWNGAFQSIRVEPGQHTVVFKYRERYLLPGAVVSLLAWFALAAVIVSDRLIRT